MSPSVDPRRAPISGVRGWLLFLCIVLTIVNPLVVLVETARVLQHFGGGYNMGTRQAVAIGVNVMAKLALAVFGFYAGSLLWAVRPGAVTAAKLYFATRLLFAAVWPVTLLKLTGLHRGPLFMKTWAGGVIGAFLLFVVCFFYLLKSRRVANTYFFER
jgi:hypothetical protein